MTNRLRATMWTSAGVALAAGMVGLLMLTIWTELTAELQMPGAKVIIPETAGTVCLNDQGPCLPAQEVRAWVTRQAVPLPSALPAKPTPPVDPMPAGPSPGVSASTGGPAVDTVKSGIAGPP
jgi:hypothetical protein